MSFSRRVRRYVCRPVPLAVTLCLIVLGLALSFTRSYRISESLIQAHFLMPEEISVPGPICHKSEDLTSSLCSPATDGDTEERIPRIIHQTYKSAEVPENWLAAYNSCKEIHQANNWTSVLWTDEAAASFIAAQYPWFLSTYTHYPYAIQRADAIRYFILHHYGGFYLDLDVGCRRDLYPLLKHDAIFPKTQPFGASNDVVAASKGHMLFQQLISSLKANSRWFGTKYPTVLFSTGPMFVTRELVRFLRKHDRRGGAGVADWTGRSPAISVRILHPALHSNSETSFFAHYRGSTWHGGDAMVAMFVWHNKIKIMGLLSVVLIGGYGLSSPIFYGGVRRALLVWSLGARRRDT